jgi:hypothetical protein
LGDCLIIQSFSKGRSVDFVAVLDKM